MSDLEDSAFDDDEDLTNDVDDNDMPLSDDDPTGGL